VVQMVVGGVHQREEEEGGNLQKRGEKCERN